MWRPENQPHIPIKTSGLRAFSQTFGAVTSQRGTLPWAGTHWFRLQKVPEKYFLAQGDQARSSHMLYGWNMKIPAVGYKLPATGGCHHCEVLHVSMWTVRSHTSTGHRFPAPQPCPPPPTTHTQLFLHRALSWGIPSANTKHSEQWSQNGLPQETRGPVTCKRGCRASIQRAWGRTETRIPVLKVPR